MVTRLQLDNLIKTAEAIYKRIRNPIDFREYVTKVIGIDHKTKSIINQLKKDKDRLVLLPEEENFIQSFDVTTEPRRIRLADYGIHILQITHPVYQQTHHSSLVTDFEEVKHRTTTHKPFLKKFNRLLLPKIKKNNYALYLSDLLLFLYELGFSVINIIHPSCRNIYIQDMQTPLDNLPKQTIDSIVAQYKNVESRVNLENAPGRPKLGKKYRKSRKIPKYRKRKSKSKRKSKK